MTPPDLDSKQQSYGLTSVIVRHGPLISLLAVLWVSCFSGLSNYALVDLVDEGAYATIARQMLTSGDWITLRIGPALYFGKPPLLCWAIAVFIKLLGPTTLAVRLPSALGVAFTSLILWWWMKRRGDELTGWLAGIFYALSPLAAGLAHVTVSEGLLTLWLTIAVLGAIDGYRGRVGGYLVMAVAAALATMTKGVIGFLLPGAMLLFWLIWWRRLADLRKPIVLAAIAIFLILVLPWHIAEWRAQGGTFLRVYFYENHFQRAAAGIYGHGRPFWFYLPVLICASFPFVIFFPRAWYAELKMLWQKVSGREITGMFFVWTTLVFLFFSASVSKLPDYILPVLPGVMVLVAARVSKLLRERRGLSRMELWLSILLSTGLGIVLLACAVLGLSWRGRPSPLPYSAQLLSGRIGWQAAPLSIERVWYRLSPFIVLAPETLIMGVLLIVAAVLFVVWRKRMVNVIATAIALSLTTIIIFAHFAMPAWSRFDIEPMWQLAEAARPAVDEGQPLVLYDIRPARHSVTYLLGRPDLVIDTTDAPVVQRAVSQYRHGYILTKTTTQIPDVPEPIAIEKITGHWVLWRFGT